MGLLTAETETAAVVCSESVGKTLAWRLEFLLGKKLLMAMAGKVKKTPWRQKVSDLERSLQSSWFERRGRRIPWASPRLPGETTAW